jgi:hypothetical protein
MDGYVGGDARWLNNGMNGWLCCWRCQEAELWDEWMAMLAVTPGGSTVGRMVGNVGGEARWLNCGMDGWLHMLVEMPGG